MENEQETGYAAAAVVCSCVILAAAIVAVIAEPVFGTRAVFFCLGVAATVFMWSLWPKE